MKNITLSILLCLSLAATAIAADTPKYINGRVERIIDGDTLIITDGTASYRVRLYGVDCPERERKGRWAAQAGSAEAKGFAGDFTAKHDVTAIVRGQDFFGRLIAEVFVAGRSLNRELVRAGHAWHYHKYAAKDRDLRRLEARARSSKRGLWERAKPVAPWVWRRKGR